MKLGVLVLLLELTIRQAVSAQTGIAVPSMARVDNSIISFMGRYGINGGAVAITKDGRLVYNRAFGFADSAGKIPAQPYTRFRIASASKPLTAIGVMKIFEDGELSLDQPVFNYRGGILFDDFYMKAIALKDTDIYKISARHLLEHTSGWDRDIRCPRVVCDPINFPLRAASETGTPNPAGDSAMIRFLLQRGLNHTPPGTRWAYSNVGYLILAKVMEARTHVKYETYMDSVIFRPLGLCDMALAKNLKSGKQEREAEYIDPRRMKSCYNGNDEVPVQYGGYNVEAMHAHGGWIATASELTRLLLAVDGVAPDILSAAILDTMMKASQVDGRYAKGWFVSGGTRKHNGSLPGTASLIGRSSDGLSWAFLFNEQAPGRDKDAFFKDLDEMPAYALLGVTFPAHDLFPPDRNVSDLKLTATSATTATLSWKNGSGNGRLIVATESPGFTAFPGDGMTYAGNAAFGSGQALDATTYVLYRGTDSSLNISSLSPGKEYRFTAFEYTTDKTGGLPVYKIGCRPEASLKSPGTGIRPTGARDELKVYPNPSRGTCTLISGEELRNTIAVLKDLNGKAIFQFPILRDKQELDLHTLPNGLYFLHFQNGRVLQLLKN